MAATVAEAVVVAVLVATVAAAVAVEVVVAAEAAAVVVVGPVEERHSLNANMRAKWFVRWNRSTCIVSKVQRNGHQQEETKHTV